MRILLVDDHESLCVALAKYIQSEVERLLAQSNHSATVTVTPVFTLTDAVAELHAAVRPSLVLLDLGLGGECQGAATLERFQLENKDKIPVAIFTALVPSDPGAVAIFRRCFKELGAQGIIIKTSKVDKMLIGLSRILGGETWMSEEVLLALLDPPKAAEEHDTTQHLGLTKREWDVARLLTQGLPTKTIASELALSRGHVSQIISTILGKLDVQNRTQAAMKVRETQAGRRRTEAH